MNKIIQFVNRVNEIDFLRKQMERENGFVVLYGRRRVGKSELLKKFIKDKKAIYLLSTQEVEKEIINSFSNDIAEFFKDPYLKEFSLKSFKQLMEYIKNKNLKNTILIIDEFPYLVDSNKAIPSILQKYWEQYLKKKGLKIILCGSSISAMETEVLGRKSPLYGRRTGQWKLEQLKFKDLKEFFKNLQIEKLIEFFSVSGGIPLYIVEFQENKNLYENCKEKIATRGSLLYEEALIILKEELREPRTYFSILKEISNKKNTVNEISNHTGIERTTLMRYIEILTTLDLIETIKPATAKENSKKTRYVLKDNYFKFWFKFIYPFKKELDSFSFNSFEKNFKENINEHISRIFEDLCIEFIKEKQFSNSLNFTKIGKQWGKFKGEKGKTYEIDVCALNEEKKEILFGECKWKEKVNALTIANELNEKTKHVDWNKETRKEFLAIFAKSFSKKITEFKGKKVYCYDLKDMQKTLK